MSICLYNSIHTYIYICMYIYIYVYIYIYDVIKWKCICANTIHVNTCRFQLGHSRKHVSFCRNLIHTHLGSKTGRWFAKMVCHHFNMIWFRYFGLPSGNFTQLYGKSASLKVVIKTKWAIFHSFCWVTGGYSIVFTSCIILLLLVKSIPTNFQKIQPNPAPFHPIKYQYITNFWGFPCKETHEASFLL